MWMTGAVSRSVRKKQQHWIAFRSGRGSHEEYKAAEKKAKNDVRRARRKFEKYLAKNAKKKPRKFYSYMNRKNKRSAVGPLKDDTGCVLASDAEMATELNRCFASVFGSNGQTCGSSTTMFFGDNRLTCVEFPVESVMAKLAALKPSSAPGPDEIHPRLLRECSQELSTPFSLLFTKSMSEGVLPDEWKATNIAPIYKKGPRNCAAS